ncbi:Carbamoyl-phosphate synthase L chain ATP-binding [Chloroherpeton thalassium ATCC 35110]|uniref:Carbamoyl-phosphate synthase L chain ATP-binding n=1 Tax=Chloroherpeton thalassium (strain ATCC 35110 / GB-78) TaxID=517418 RepID=B3QYX8_CHLT3|nr:acetyl-CoA carboxylase biotin carboxylase subunit [Chloroherpeton thalassium]ACF13671.1 Carbamoyl-phosphate synthase L chain ATP-binding [Chloroherpeton thalassium ATCC 35110]
MAIQKVLVANRGEIAIRVFRTLKEMGVKSVAVYSDADKKARFYQLADEAYCIGGITSRESYLVQEKIFEVAEKSGCDAIHPGYGFLSENAAFAKACAERGLIFIGPKPDVIQALGDKIEARKIAIKANLPIASGTEGSIENLQEASQVAEKVGFPVLIKATAGGGGKGMKKVESKELFASSFNAARNEALAAFGDGRVYIEKYLENPRHVEIQILCDSYGNGAYLFERECSIQRRHQKVIEEAPSSILTPDMRQEMGECALRIAKEVGYENAGTVEFLVDKHRKFYFLEVNTRLQVEHPVTEMITGIDLVREQVKIAQGEPLSFTQDDLQIMGHSIECRIYAEDSENFMPSTGVVPHYVEPNGFGIRTDSAIQSGSEISMYYDPMIAKLVVWDKNRESAILKMRRALSEYEIAGVDTTIPFCQFALRHEAFCSGEFDTHFIQNFYFNREKAPLGEKQSAVAAIAAAIFQAKQNGAAQETQKNTSSRVCSSWEKRKMMR